METFNESIELTKALKDVERLRTYNVNLKLEVIKLKKIIRHIKNTTNEIK
tara:strand:+ start:313 stop:462 length:150 start_codon:yes stop_codon:yes gene_type:complete